MASFLHHTLFTSALFFLLTSSSSSSSHPKPSKSSNLDPHCQNEPIRAAYYPSWATIPPSSINTNYFSHIFYAFLNPNPTTFTFNITKPESLALKKFTSALHSKKPPVRTLFSVGGGGDFSRMVSSKQSRAAFIASSVKVANDHEFDGCDLDYEFPNNSTDMDNLGKLFDEWRKAAGPDFLITAAVYYSADSFLSGPKRAYPARSITKNLNWTNVMAYDYRGSWDTSATGAHAALYDAKTNVSTNFGIGRWIEAGVPSCMLVVGMPLYGRTWTLKDQKSHGVGAPATAVGPGQDGTMTYDEIVKYNLKHNVTGVFDSDTVSVYSYFGKDWIGYDDVRSVAMKVSFARAMDLRGYFFWQIAGDHDWTISKRASDVMLLLNQKWDARS